MQAVNVGDPCLPERFWRRVMPEPNSGCWLWIGACNAEGYGRIEFDGRTLYTHRVAYQAFVRPILPGEEIDHLCKTPDCCNPLHLEAVSHTVNVRRSSISVRLRTTFAAIKACPKGHEYTTENTYVRTLDRGRGAYPCRQCRACGRERAARAALKRMAND